MPSELLPDMSELRTLTARLEAVLRLAKIGPWMVDFERSEVLFDQRLLDLLGWNWDRHLALPIRAWLDLIHPDDAARQLDLWNLCLHGERDTYEIEHRIRRPDGTWLACAFRASVYGRSPQGLARRIVGSYQECCSSRNRHEDIHVAATVFAHTREGITITDPQGAILDANPSFSRITGYSREEIIGQNPRILQSGRQSPAFYAAMWQAIKRHGHWSGEIWNRRKDGSLFLEVLTIRSVHDETGALRHYVALFSDVTQSRETEQRLERMAHFDVLTHLPNRVLLLDRLRQSMVQCQRRACSLAVAFLDLDGFKAINDRHGHTVGDELLIALARRMGQSLREGDTLARIGGDEFVVVIADLERPQDFEPMLQGLLHAASEPVAIGRATLQISASIGVTLYPGDAVDAEQLLRHADQAMYQAKLAGKNRMLVFDVEHDAAQAHQRLQLQEIRAALDAHEFELYYQPKVNLRTGAVIGTEALIRWNHPQRGLLAPAAFLPIIDNHVLAKHVGEWVIATALAQMSDWRARGLVFVVSVNVGAYQLLDEDFARRLDELLQAQPDVDAQYLEIEILESSVLADMVQISELMRCCQSRGVRFALDDFGTGFSSLTYMRRLPAQVIKIDRSFVRHILSDADDLSIVQGVIGLANAFRREVIAEGVESREHGDMLLELGCELAQGDGIAAPMPALEVPVWVQSWTQSHRAPDAGSGA